MAGRVVSRARQVRLNHQARLGRLVSIEEVARVTKIDRAALTRLELGQTYRFDGHMLAKLCAYYQVGVGEILEFSPEETEETQAPGMVVA